MTEAEISASIQRTFRRSIWGPFCRAIDAYGLIRPGDRIAVCYSGGKDSSLLLCCLREYRRYGGVPFEMEVLTLDPGYSGEHLERTLENARLMGFEPKVVSCPIFEALKAAPHSRCHVCAAMRRGYLYENAKRLGCNKIALGHHMDDAAETVLMSLLYGGQYRGMMPRLNSDSHPGMELIRPMYLIRERDVVAWAEAAGLEPITCACDVTRQKDQGARARTKKLLKTLEEETPNVIGNIIGSLSRVSLDTVLAWRTDQNAPWVHRLDGSSVDRESVEQRSTEEKENG